MRGKGLTVIALSLTLSFIFLPHASGAVYKGVIISDSLVNWAGWNTGLNSAFIAIRVYWVETEYPSFMLSFGIPFPPIRYPSDNGWWNNWTDYLFYINGSSAYLVETITPNSPTPVRFTFPSYAYLGSGQFCWYLILDHNATPLRLSPRHAIGIYRFNGSCLEKTTVENSTEFPWQLQGSTLAIIEDYGSYMLFEPGAKGSLGWTPFNVSKALLNQYFGPNTTRNSVFGVVFMNRSAVLIVPFEGFFEGNGSYYFLKPVKFNPAGDNYTVVAAYSDWRRMPYYGVLVYPYGFIPLLKYDPTKPGWVSLASNVKPFRVPLCKTASGGNITSTPGRTRTPVRTPQNPSSTIPVSTLLLGSVSGVGVGLVIGAVLGWRREWHEED